MSLGKRLRLIFEMKGNVALDAAEDPTQVMNLSYEKQLSGLQCIATPFMRGCYPEKFLLTGRTRLSMVSLSFFRA